MYTQTLEKIIDNAQGKINLINKSFGKYIVASMLAGFYVGLAIFLIMIIGTFTKSVDSNNYRIFMGLSFGIALSLVLMTGSELFTGTNMVMTSSLANKSSKAKDLLRIWGVSYLGNLLGSILVGLLFVYSQSASSGVKDFILSYAQMKVSYPPMTIFFKGIMCNILVCLAVLSYIRLKEETAKLIMVFWCLFAFITAGYEHSIANMSLFSAAYFLDTSSQVSIFGMAYNLFWATLGNIVGGSSLGLAYYYIGKK